MNKSWIDLPDRLSVPYIQGIDEFLKFAYTNKEEGSAINCPCRICVNRYTVSREDVIEHLHSFGFLKKYKNWIYHGESYANSVGGQENEAGVYPNLEDDLVGMLHGVATILNIGTSFESGETSTNNRQGGPDAKTQKILNLLESARRPLYPGCEKFTVLSFVVRLLHMRYFPLKERMQRMFLTPKHANLMRWHAEERQNDSVFRHPADSLAWKEFDKLHTSFSSDCRNVRFGLASDGFNPFGNMNLSHSTWPIILIPYNLPSWICMKHSNFIFFVLIDGPKSPGDNIDVYMHPLIEELKELWEEGVQ